MIYFRVARVKKERKARRKAKERRRKEKRKGRKEREKEMRYKYRNYQVAVGSRSSVVRAPAAQPGGPGFDPQRLP